MSSKSQNNPNKIIAFIATLICIILVLIPVPEALKIYKPDWPLLLLVFLAIHIPKEFNLEQHIDKELQFQIKSLKIFLY